MFCLMPNHFHLLVRFVHGNLSNALKHLVGGYVKMRRLLRSGKGPDELEDVLAAVRKKRSLDGS